MRILQVTPFFYPAWAYAGVPRVVYQLSRTLVKRGHEVTVYSTDAMDRRSRIRGAVKDIDGIKVHHFKNISNLLAYDYRIPISPGIIPVIRRDAKDFDIVHLHTLRTIQNVIVHHYVMKYGVPYVLQLHGLFTLRGKLRAQRIFDAFFSSRLLNDASKIVVLSDFVLRHLSLDRKKVTIIPNGVDLGCENPPPYGRFREKFGIKQEHVVLFLGRVGVDKGLDFLVRGFSLLARDLEDVALVISGPNDGYEHELRNLVRKLKIEDKVTFTGFLTEEVACAYVDADVLVNPKAIEEFGLVPFEAILCGTPVIVIRGSGCAEWLKKTGGGYSVRYGDALGLKKLMLKALENRNVQREVNKAKMNVIKNFSWDKVAASMEELYEDICFRRMLSPEHSKSNRT